ncbi:MAG TPA: ParB/RepB/Spo0J family partition protein [Pirellulales bacterium]|nr:ParB/RepB/Spo0J family partition protein [Pirellulales bacterium]
MQKFGRIPISSIVPDPQQPRKLFASGEIAAFAEDIKKHGVHVPVIGFLDGHTFVLIDGERRLRAALIAGLADMPAIMLTERPSKAQLRVLQNSLDAHREQLTPMERSNLLAEIQRETGWSVGELVEQLSMKQSEVSKLLAYQRLAQDIQDMLQAGTIRTDQAYLISQTSDFAEQLQLLKSSEGLSRDQFRTKVKGNGQTKTKAKRATFMLPGGMNIIVSGGESTLEQAIDGLTAVLKELRRGLSQGLDIVTAQRVLKDKAKGGRDEPHHSS